MNETTVVGKNFEWDDGKGLIVKNQAGVKRISFLNPETSWTSSYESVSLTTVGPGFPVSGMNEKGLTVEALVNSADHPDTPLSPLSEVFVSLEALQYILDKTATIDEVEDLLADFNMVQVIIALHFFVCDAHDQCLVIERENGVTRLTRLDPDFKVLANNPYHYDRDLYGEQDVLHARDASLFDSSPRRFAALARLSKSSDPTSSEDVFSWLDTSKTEELIQWQIVWQRQPLKLNFKTHLDKGSPARSFTLDLFKTREACKNAPDVASIERGDLKFQAYNEEDVQKVKTRLLELVTNQGSLFQSSKTQFNPSAMPERDIHGPGALTASKSKNVGEVDLISAIVAHTQSSTCKN